MANDVMDNPLFTAALVLLLEEHGGSIDFTDADYQAVKVKYGGAKGFTINAEVTPRGAGEQPSVTVRLVNRQPGSGRPT